MILPVIVGIVLRGAIQYAARVAAANAARAAASTAARTAASAAAARAGHQLSRTALKRILNTAQRYGDDVLKKERDARKACKTCKQLDDLADPCQFLKSGSPANTGFRGGNYNGTRAPGIESHHMPAQSAYPAGSMSAGKMPAIAMTPADHHQTESYRNSADSRQYQQLQRQAIARGGLAAGFAMDVADIKMKFGNKYDRAIIEAAAYLACITKYPNKYPVGGTARPSRGRRP